MDPVSEDSDLLRRIANRDETSFAKFYDRHSSRIYSLVVRILGTAEGADDVLQEVFWQVWQRAEQFNPRLGKPLTWLILIARSRALDCRRRVARRPKPLEGAPEASGDSDALAPVEQEERARMARAALENLSADQRRTIQFAFFDGLTHSEIAQQENLPLGTVKTRIRDGMTKLRDALVVEGWECHV